MESLHATVGRPRGFTLLEMIVAVAIIAVVISITILGQNDFNRAIIATDTAYTVALSVRQAQAFGLSSRTANSTPNTGYGVHFEAATPTGYLLFADLSRANYALVSPLADYCPVGTVGQPDAKPGNCRYDPSGTEVVQNFKFGRGFSIAQFCGHDTASVLHCTPELTQLDVVFVRPNTDSVITGVTGGGVMQLIDASIKVVPPNGGERYVCVSRVGQVSVATSSCP